MMQHLPITITCTSINFFIKNYIYVTMNIGSLCEQLYLLKSAVVCWHDFLRAPSLDTDEVVVLWCSLQELLRVLVFLWKKRQSYAYCTLSCIKSFLHSIVYNTVDTMYMYYFQQMNVTFKLIGTATIYYFSQTILLLIKSPLTIFTTCTLNLHLPIDIALS
jgi:hypothetical protein